MGILWVVTFYSCAPSQDTSPEARESDLREREALFHAAYAEFDAAVLARLLDEDYVLRQLDQSYERSRTEWLTELQSLQTVFPRLRITVDQIEMVLESKLATVKGQRTFTWTQGTESGSYREDFENHWRYAEGNWTLLASEVRALP